MNVVSALFNNILPIFMISALGYFWAAKYEIDLEGINDVIVYIAAPALVLSSFFHTTIVWRQLYEVALTGVGVLAFTYILARIVVSQSKRDITGLYLPVLFMNSANMGIPINHLAFGDQGTLFASLYYVVMSFCNFSIGILLVNHGSDWHRFFRLPLIYATMTGMVMNATGSTLPNFLKIPVEMLGEMCIPLMLFLLGYRLYSVKITAWQLTLIGTILRIGGGFVGGLIMVTILDIQGVCGKVLILASSMPSAVINFMLAEKFNRNPELVASVIALTTVLSLLTSTLIVAWLK